MSAPMSGWLAQALATDTPLLPTLGAMQLWLHLGWSVVLAWLATLLVPRRAWAAALLAALWSWAPGAYSPAYWLGLAFQAPSVVTVLLCAGGLAALSPRPLADRRVLALALLGALAGWALLLDSFALLPLPLYAWGFSPLAAGLIALVALLPWAMGRGGDWAQAWRLAVVPLAVLALVLWRLPTGNAWDAVLDPWLWLALQVHLARVAGAVLQKK